MMKPKFKQVLEMAIEDGISRGWNIAHKHTDVPTDEAVKESIYQCVCGSLYEWFDFEEDGE